MKRAENERSELETLAAALSAAGVAQARLALVLGSGLGGFAQRLDGARAIPYEELPGMPRSAVPGHAGKLVLGEIAGVPLVVQQGRVHLYEGWSAREVTRAVRAFAALGVGGLVLTNAAGGLAKEWKVPALMRVTDHLNLQHRSPLRREEQRLANPYDTELGAALERAARELELELHRGVYAGLLGPSYETAAEIEMLRWMGADAVGMSTVAEASAGFACGMKVAAVSCITNHAAGVADHALSHEEVVEAGAQAAERFGALLERSVPHLAAALG